ncbi:SBBP repeat-containing protein [Acidobacteriota bacterium]
MCRFHGEDLMIFCLFRESSPEARRRHLPFFLRTFYGITLMLALAGVIAPTSVSAITMPGSGTTRGSTLNLWPPSFERNEGQAPEEVCFFSRGTYADLFLTGNEVIMISGPNMLRMRLVGVNRRSRPIGLNELPHRSNYFIGRDPSKWRTDVHHFERIEYSSLYRGIDMVARVLEGLGWEVVFVVSPKGSPRTIRFQFAEAGSVRIESNGDIAIDVSGATYHVERPIAFQEDAAGRREVRCRYVVLKEDEIGIEVGRYDTRTPLVIDPMLHYSTYLGGTDDDGANAIAVDGCGNAYVVGSTQSLDFPTLNPFQAQSKKTRVGLLDGFIAKFDAKGALAYSTYIGGSGHDSGGPENDYAKDVAVDVDGQVYVTGTAYSTDFPIQSAWQPIIGGKCDAFVTKIDSTGQQLVYSTFLGGDASDYGEGIAIDGSGNAYVAGDTQGGFPTLNALQPSMGGGPWDTFLTKLDSAGMAIYSTYLGGTWPDMAESVAVDSGVNAVVTGRTFSTDFPLKNPFQGSNSGLTDAFVTKVNPAGTGLVFSTYLGGTGDDFAQGVAVDVSSSDIYVVGRTRSPNFPTFAAFQGTLRGAEDGFVSKFDASGGLIYSTYLGGTGKDGLGGVAVAPSGDTFVIGTGDSTDYPTASPVQPVSGGDNDVLVSVLVPDGSSFVYSTYLGGSTHDGDHINFDDISVAVDSFGNAYVAGSTFSVDFPVKNPAQATHAGGPSDAFVAVIDNGGGSTIPGPVGNTLMAVKDTPGSAIVFTWNDIAVATGYELYQHDIKSSTVWSSVATALTGSPPGLPIPMTGEQILFFKVAGTNCGVAGPK